jgi:hypothetical protein
MATRWQRQNRNPGLNASQTTAFYIATVPFQSFQGEDLMKHSTSSVNSSAALPGKMRRQLWVLTLSTLPNVLF